MNKDDMIKVLQTCMFFRDGLTEYEIECFGFDHKLIKIGHEIFEGLIFEEIGEVKKQ